MEVAEIKVSYSNTNFERIKVTSSQMLYSLVLKQWNLDLIEFQEEVKIVLLNRGHIVLGVYELSKGGTSGTVVDLKIILGIWYKIDLPSPVGKTAKVLFLFKMFNSGFFWLSLKELNP